MNKWWIQYETQTVEGLREDVIENIEGPDTPPEGVEVVEACVFEREKTENERLRMSLEDERELTKLANKERDRLKRILQAEASQPPPLIVKELDAFEGQAEYAKRLRDVEYELRVAKSDDAKTQKALDHVLELNKALYEERDQARAAMETWKNAYHEAEKAIKIIDTRSAKLVAALEFLECRGFISKNGEACTCTRCKALADYDTSVRGSLSSPSEKSVNCPKCGKPYPNATLQMDPREYCHCTRIISNGEHNPKGD